MKKISLRPKIGDTFFKDSVEHRIEELFVADNTRWVRCTKLRKKSKVWISGKRFTIYDTDNIYITEYEWAKTYNK